MRQPLLGRSCVLVFACLLAGCATLDSSSLQPNSRLTRDEQQTQQLIEEANRKARAGDVEGAKQLLARLEERDRKNKPIGRTSLRGTELEGRDLDSSEASHRNNRVTKTDELSTDDMVEELVHQGDPASIEHRRSVLRAMSPTQIRKMYRENPTMESNPVDSSREVSIASASEVPLITPKISNRITALAAPDPRAATSGSGVVHAAATHPATAPNKLPNDLVVHALATTPAAGQSGSEIELMGGSGVSLLGIQTGPADSPNLPPRPNSLPAPATSAGNSLPVISPGPANQGGLPVIVPKGGRLPPPTPDRGIQHTQGFAGPNTIEPANRTLTGDLAAPRVPNPQLSGPAGIGAMFDPSPSPPGQTLNPPNQSAQQPGFPLTGPAMSPPNQPLPIPGSTPGAGRASESTVDPKKSPRSFVQSAVKEVRNVTERTRLFGSAESATVQAPLTATADISTLITSLENQLVSAAPGTSEAEKLEYVRKHVNLRMLHLIAGSSDKALEPIRGIDPQDQEFWQQLLWGISNYFDSQGMPRAGDRATQTVNQLRTAAQHLKQQADLELRNVSFCQKIDSYGNYDRSTRDKFPAGLPALLYAEVENFRSIPAEGDRYMTALKSTIEFYKSRGDGRMLYSIPFDLNQDYCRNRRRDYFLAYEFVIPQQLEPGAYTLVLKVEDALGQKVSTSKVNFVVE